MSLVMLAAAITLGSCGDAPTPKPRVYSRIDLPRHDYQPFEPPCPFSFAHAQIAVAKAAKVQIPCQYNIEYPSLNSTIHLTYKPVLDNLPKLLEDSRDLVMKHTVKASAIEDSLVYREDARVFGLTYAFSGKTASIYQFFVTDSAKHFLRGSVYINVIPNPDSLEPVIEYLQDDAKQLVGSLEWK